MGLLSQHGYCRNSIYLVEQCHMLPAVKPVEVTWTTSMHIEC